MGLSLRGLLPIALIFSVAWGAPRRALALAPSPAVRVEAEGITHTAPRSGNLLPNQLNGADCRADDQITFPLVLINRATYTLEAWVGFTDCTPNAARDPRLGTCSKLYSADPRAISSVSNVFPLTLHARDLIAALSLVDTGSDTASMLITGTGPEICSGSKLEPFSTPLQVSFLLVDSSGVAVATDTWSANFKLGGPTPPDQLTLASSDQSLTASFSYDNTTDGFSADTTLDSYEFFCDPAPGPAPDSGALDCAGSPTLLVPGQLPDGLDAQQCGTAERSVNSANIAGLTNGVLYRVAVSAVDTYGNVGPLSKIACAAPSRAAAPREDRNVKACSFAPPPAQSPLGLLALLASALGLTIRFARSSARARCRARVPSR